MAKTKSKICQKCGLCGALLLNKSKEAIIKIKGNYLQSYKYFNNYIGEIKEFYKFKENIQKGGELIAKKLFGNGTKGFKFCVHIRRGDFIKIGQASKKQFTNKAINFLIPKLEKKFNQKNISIVLFGKDKNFINELEIDKKYKIYMPEINNSGVNMYFAINYCNSYLITASSSTFAWWIGFLMPEEVPIFYYNCHLECIHIKKKDYFLPKWKGINYNYLGKLKFV
uniref:Alpha-1,2-fucosyltransferase n=1 Tax=Meloidogyne incognita TaxID=6306 RepID=A0A914MIL7_MELIC